MKKKNRYKKSPQKRPASRRVLTGKTRRYYSSQEILTKYDNNKSLQSILESCQGKHIISVEIVLRKSATHRRLDVSKASSLKVIFNDGSKLLIDDPDFPFPKDPQKSAKLIKIAKTEKL